MEALHQKIQQKAYLNFLERGGKHGNDLGDWLKAEKEILSQENGSKKKTLKFTKKALK